VRRFTGPIEGSRNYLRIGINLHHVWMSLTFSDDFDRRRRDSADPLEADIKVHLNADYLESWQTFTSNPFAATIKLNLASRARICLGP
jgi:hypothetical protein